ncbi:MAG: tetratricopeptide repeat protein [Candidatus Omnitrophica bacterium]|nr:tetratricopeptide repeat protein [Candidatus Omnitrophota bacterium]
MHNSFRRVAITLLILVTTALFCLSAGAAEIQDAFSLLKIRKDNQALAVFEELLQRKPNNCGALWGKAEILRRKRRFQESEIILNQVLQKNPDYPPALISLAYIRYHDNRLKEALKLTRRALKSKPLSKENEAMAFMMLGTINSKRSSQGWIINKIQYGTQIKSFFLKAVKIDPGLAEAHLGLGIFYLKAPVIAGGNVDKAIEELTTALRLAPDFATATARLAQAYKKKGDSDKYKIYLRRAEELDSGNEALKELREQ